ncbi:lipopolysaccharide biosynthesis protein [Muricauda sp. 2012CJ35-5]|uniref:Lipopolysaccharide biosynthesis protein n=1 Tax=Flagellimonas spongiicola TaxID=2942208 RepID=A0ABT0PW93_9FLAO|nr:lipopolysaccharide biosynthesis protein [Allomuricauda spongiicola]MCL6275551.1 lipopolysaccharide biosynthesis protein [Allomuricauda spongiicola]
MSLGKKMFHGVVWSGLEKISIQLVQFVIGIILARILTPKEYGIIGILYVFIAISNVFIDSGFTKALIQKQDRTEEDKSTVFWFNLLISLVCYILLWITAPYIADFYELDVLKNLLRVLALVLIINSLFTVPTTLLNIDLDFKTLAKINFISVFGAGMVAIYLAMEGYGVWALAYQTLLKSILSLVMTWFWVRWKPRLLFSKASFGTLFSYGSNLLVSSLLGVAVNNFYALFIAKLISTKDLGYYTRGTQFSDFVYGTISSILDSVLLPGLSTIQEQRDVLIAQTRKVIKLTALITIPVFLLLALMAKPIIITLLTEKWAPAAPIMQFFCIARLITIISGINVNLLYVIGRTDLALRQQYSKIAIRVVLLVVSLKYGIVIIALAELISTIIHFFINTYHPGKIMGYGALSQIKDMKMIFLSSILMVMVTFLSVYFIDDNLVKVCIAPLAALGSYYLCMRIFKIEEWNSLFAMSRKFLKK